MRSIVNIAAMISIGRLAHTAYSSADGSTVVFGMLLGVDPVVGVEGFSEGELVGVGV